MASDKSNPDSQHEQSPSRKRPASAEPSPQAKKAKKDGRQATLEETIPDSDMKEAADDVESKQANGSSEHPDHEESTTEMGSTGKVDQREDAKAAADFKTENGSTVETLKEREESVPSSILEKGIIYFLTRGRVGVDNPEGVQDIARSYMVLRPLPNGAKLNEGAIEDLNNNRLLALPKKVLPKAGQDKFLSFVEKAGVTIQELKDQFMAGSEYATKTTGVRHTPPATPIGEGVYAITSTGRDTHLAYMTTIPGEIGEVQEEMGIMQQGSFHLSVKNPDQPSPANASLAQKPEYPEEMMKEFHGLRWLPTQPKHLDYVNTSFLLIGERAGELGNAVEPSAKDQKHDKETPQEEMEKLEHEDEVRANALKDDHAIFADLGISKKDYPGTKTTW